MDVFLVQHTRELDDVASEDVKMIGVYSSRNEAERAVARLAQLPGFREHPAGFHIDQYRLDEDHWVTGFVTTLADPSLAASHATREGGANAELAKDMVETTLVLKLEGSAAACGDAVGTPRQLHEIFASLQPILKSHVWFCCTVESVGQAAATAQKFTGRVPELVGGFDELQRFIDSAEQFIWATFLAVPAGTTRPEWSRAFDAEDAAGLGIGPATVQVRVFDSSFVEVEAKESATLLPLVERFGGAPRTMRDPR